MLRVISNIGEQGRIYLPEIALHRKHEQGRGLHAAAVTDDFHGPLMS
jgi:hypothetical protein